MFICLKDKKKKQRKISICGQEKSFRQGPTMTLFSQNLFEFILSVFEYSE